MIYLAFALAALAIRLTLFALGIALFILISVPVAAIAGAIFVALYLKAYLRAGARAMGVGPGSAAAPVPAPPPAHTDAGLEPAYRQYLFGPAIADMRHLVVTAWPDLRAQGTTFYYWVKDKFFDYGGSNSRRAVGVLVAGGLLLGTIFAVAVSTVVFTGQVVLWGLLLGLGLLTVFVLRGVDTVLLRVRRIRLNCPSCHHRVAYPAYECPSCLVRHHDIRPGRYGLARRICGCGRTMPTLLFLGSHKMTAYCPYCDAPMAGGAGAVPEIVLPVLGATGSGKTRLRGAFGLLIASGLAAEPADLFTEQDQKELADRLRAGAATVKTNAGAIRAHTFRLRSGRDRRLLHIYDPAGERLSESARLQELRYMMTAGAFIFVLDPTVILAVWDELPPSARAEFDRTVRHGPAFIFGQVLQNIESMGVPTRKRSLAVAITKSDLVRDLPVFAGTGDASDDLRHWLSTRAGLDNMVRSMHMSFGEVRYFRISSMLADSRVDPQIERLATWTLGECGLAVPGR